MSTSINYHMSKFVLKMMHKCISFLGKIESMTSTLSTTKTTNTSPNLNIFGEDGDVVIN